MFRTVPRRVPCRVAGRAAGPVELKFLAQLGTNIWLKFGIQIRARIWGSKCGPSDGAQILHPILDRKFGTRFWGRSLVAKWFDTIWAPASGRTCGIQIWRQNLVSDLGHVFGSKIWDSNLGAKTCVPILGSSWGAKFGCICFAPS